MSFRKELKKNNKWVKGEANNKMNELVQMFDNQEVKIKTDKGNTLINLIHTAKCCGITDIRKNNIIVVRWGNVKKKLNTINSSGTNLPLQYIDEISYILDEIDNTDDRNSIYMSSWLSKRLAMECHSDKAMRYKNFLATLDEVRENGQLAIDNNNIQIANMVGQVMNQVLPTLTKELAMQFAPIIIETKETVNRMAGLMHDQSEIYDQDRESLKDLIGFKSTNTIRIVNIIKEKLSEKFGMKIMANSSKFLKVKKEVFKEFEVIKWEDIPVEKYSSVFAFVDTYIGDEIF